LLCIPSWKKQTMYFHQTAREFSEGSRTNRAALLCTTRGTSIGASMV
jgi:hypothetical protein